MQPAHAAQRAFVLDAQRYGVQNGRNLTTATAALVYAGRGGDASLAVSRLDDSFDGAGYAVGVGAAVAFAPVVSLRGGFTRVARNDALDAWSVRVGPEFHAGPTTLALAGFHSRREDGLVTRGAALDLERMVSPKVWLRTQGSFARTAGEPDAGAGAIGARWNAIGPLHLLGEVGLARDPAGALSGGPGGPGSGGVLGGVLPGSSPGTDADSNRAHPTARLGVRLILP
jgi:hypothetical protein